MEYLHACFLQSPGCEPEQGPFFLGHEASMHGEEGQPDTLWVWELRLRLSKFPAGMNHMPLGHWEGSINPWDEWLLLLFA